MADNRVEINSHNRAVTLRIRNSNNVQWAIGGGIAVSLGDIGEFVVTDSELIILKQNPPRNSATVRLHFHSTDGTQQVSISMDARDGAQTEIKIFNADRSELIDTGRLQGGDTQVIQLVPPPNASQTRPTKTDFGQDIKDKILESYRKT